MRDLVRPRRQYLPGRVRYILSGIDRIDPEKKAVLLANGESLRYEVDGVISVGQFYEKAAGGQIIFT